MFLENCFDTSQLARKNMILGACSSAVKSINAFGVFLTILFACAHPHRSIPECCKRKTFQLVVSKWERETGKTSVVIFCPGGFLQTFYNSV